MPGEGRTGYASSRTDRTDTTEERGSASGWRSNPTARSALILALSLALVFGVVRPFGAEAFRVSSESMAPTLRAFRGVGDGVMIKRAVGLPGDTVAVRDGVLHVNGGRVAEPYVNYELNDSNYFGPERVPEGSVFVMGDHRENSRDSREFGPVRREDLIGRVLLRVWPV